MSTTSITRPSRDRSAALVWVAAFIVPVSAMAAMLWVTGGRGALLAVAVLGVTSLSGFLRFGAIAGLPRLRRRVLTVPLAAVWWAGVLYAALWVFAFVGQTIWPWTDWTSHHATLRPIAASDDFDVRTSWSVVTRARGARGQSSRWAVPVSPIGYGSSDVEVRTTTVDRAMGAVIASSTRVVSLDWGAQLRYRVREDGTWTDVEAGGEVVGGWVAFR